MTANDESALSRRRFLGALSALGLGSVALPQLLRAAPTAAKPPAGLQLYTVRALMEKDVPGTLRAIAAIGVREVEFAGYFNHSAAALRVLLADAGLSAPAAHVGTPKDWAPVLDDAAMLGHKWVIVPWVGNDVRGSADGWRRLADELNAAGLRAKSLGIRVGYHNHDFEFTQVNGERPFDLLLERTDAALVDFELDLYWAVKAGMDPMALLAKYPGRFPLWHLKDAGPLPERAMRDVGAGTIDFSALFAASTARGLQHAFIEHDNPADPLSSVRASVSALARLG